MFNNIISFVQKRDGGYQEIDFAKIQNRLKYLAKGYPSRKNKDNLQLFTLDPLNNINITFVTQEVIKSVVDKIPTNKIDELTANICSENAHRHPDYNEMASRIIISNHHKNTRTRNFLGMTEYLYLDKNSSVINKHYYKFIECNWEKIEEAIDYNRDYGITYFGFKTLEKSYLLKTNNDEYPIEKPQDAWMRIAISLNLEITELPSKSI